MTLLGRSADPDSASAADWCPIERALEVIGTRSALLLLRESFCGARRFEDLARLAGISEQSAATRLRQLVDAGMLAKQPYKEPGKRTRYEYVLTARGRQIFPVIVSLIEFGLVLHGAEERHGATVKRASTTTRRAVKRQKPDKPTVPAKRAPAR